MGGLSGKNEVINGDLSVFHIICLATFWTFLVYVL